MSKNYVRKRRPIVVGAIVSIVWVIIFCVYSHWTNQITVSGKLVDPTGAPDQFAGEVMRIYHFSGPNAVGNARQIKNDYETGSIADLSSLLVQIQAKGGSLERNVVLEGASFEVPVHKGVTLVVLLCKGFGWTEAIDAKKDVSLDLGPRNASRGY